MYLGIDYGTKRIGLALGHSFPYGAGVLNGTEDIKEIGQKIQEICQLNEVTAIVLGMPIRSQGEPGTLAPKIQLFGQELSHITGLPIIYEPEQFTSSSAEEYLKESGKKYKRSEGKVDELAAILILEQYLNEEKND